MNKKNELLKNTGLIGIGKFSSQLVSFLMLPLYTSVLSTEEYGTVDLILSYIQLLLPVVNMQLDQALFRFLVNERENQDECTIVISTMGFFSIIQLIVYSCIFFVCQFFISSPYKWFFLINIIFSVFSSFVASSARGLGNNGIFSLLSFVGVLTTVLLNILLLTVFPLGVNGMLIASGVSALLSSVLGMILLKLHRYISFNAVDKSRVKEYYSYAIPLIPNQLAWWAMKASDKTVINIFVSVAANGLIAVASKFSSAYIMVYNLFNLAWAESVVMHIDDEDGVDYIEEAINSTFSLFASLCFGIIACMPVAFRLLVNVSYNDAYNLVPIYMLAVLFNAVVGLYSAIYVARKDTRAVAMTSGIAAIINIVIDLALVKFIGVYAAPVSSVVGFLVVMVYRYFQSRKYITVKLHSRILIPSVAVGVFVVVLYYLNTMVGNILSFVIAVVFAVIINRKMFSGIVSEILHIKK